MTDILSRQLLLQHSITRALDNFKKVGKQNLNGARIRTRIAALKDNWRLFQDGHATLLSSVPADRKASLDYFRDDLFAATEEVYQSTWEHMTECLEELEPVVSHNHSFEQSIIRSESASLPWSHLPQIRLPPFDGNYAEWESFRDRFSALIIKNKDLSDFARMHYLASSLKGRALECIGNITITAENFNVAWHTLTARYENKRRLLSYHLSSLLNVSAVPKESASELQTLCDKFNVSIASLRNLKRSPSHLWNDFLVHILVQKLDPGTRKAWTLKTSDTDTLPTYDDLHCFLSTRVRALEEAAPSSVAKPSSKSAPSARVNVATASTSPALACPQCKAKHYFNACPDFLAQTPKQRREIVKKFKRCFNCLSASHSVQTCRSKYSCRTCGKKHHTTLHLDAECASASLAVSSPSPPPAAPTAEVNALLASAKPDGRSRVLLATARVQVRVASGRKATVRALLDQGSEATFISEALTQTLRGKRIRMPIAISAVGGAQVATVQHAASVFISPTTSSTPSFAVTALILKSLTAYSPKRVLDLSSFAHLSDLAWADPDPMSSDAIHMIIGADLYSDLISEGVRKGKSGCPIAQNSVFGWIISGPLPSFADSSSSTPDSPSVSHSSIRLTVHHCASLPSLAEEMRRFWEIEELPCARSPSPSDEQCEAHFRKTHTRLPDGRYMVRLPFKKDPPIDIGRSRLSAERMFNSLMRRFHSAPDTETEYVQFMRDYEALGHMRPVPNTTDPSVQPVYIPHHPVFREGSATTHLRVVFNASSVTSNGSSLNDHLLAGPKLQKDLPAIISQWRKFKFVYTADIAKMFRQILVDERDVDYQRILWRDDSFGCRDYQLLTVTYGLTSAPYLALRVLQALADDDGHRFSDAVSILKNQTYVDDLLFGGDEIESVRLLRDHIIALLRGGKFELRKWASNHPDLLADIDPSDHGLACDKQLAIDDRVTVLGVAWNPSRDAFRFNVSLLASSPRTKRAILSTIARLYDPLGWVTPVTVYAKILMQRLWREKLGWDDNLEGNLLADWQAIYDKLACLNDIRIGRWIGVRADNVRAELHGFADASTQAYAASVYLKVTSADGEVIVSLLAGKSKVAPLAPLTIPRLELSAALLLARLVVFVRSSLDFASVPCLCWTDSKVVLAWLRSHPSRWKTFVANRVHAIQTKLPDSEWRYVPTSDNPADCASRGVLGDALLTHHLWWQGPRWLRDSREAWPSEPALPPNEIAVEAKPVALHLSLRSAPWDLSSRYSSWPKLVRVTAYIFKFIYACRRIKSDIPGSAISSAECQKAKEFWIRYVQLELFPEDLRMLHSGKSVATSSPIVALNPFVDTTGVLRVGGRLRHAPLPYRVRHPILLAAHSLVRLIILQAHQRSLHGGLTLTSNILRQDFWILRSRGLVKQIIHNCVTCVRERAAVPSQIMGDLPRMRVSPPSRCFSHCGLDYAGPVRVRSHAGRGVTSRKAYIAIFICMATKAVHLELVGDYSSKAFVGAYTRFCSRRGHPHAIYSDNGTTFVGAERDLSMAYRAAIRDPNFLNSTASDKVEWHFIPPAAPHFGGLWEAGVRSVKHHMKRVIGDHTLSIEEFTTLLCGIEACLNSRPLAPLSDSFDNVEVLTPGHFLIGSSLTVAPEPSLLSLNENRLSRWQLVRHITERFWKVWASDYINTLQQRHKWRRVTPAAKIGQLVLIRNPNLPPCKWELGRISKLHPGPDGLIRVVTVKTAASEFKRPLVKICILPVDSDNTAPRS